MQKEHVWWRYMLDITEWSYAKGDLHARYNGAELCIKSMCWSYMADITECGYAKGDWSDLLDNTTREGPSCRLRVLQWWYRDLKVTWLNHTVKIHRGNPKTRLNTRMASSTQCLKMGVELVPIEVEW